MKEQCNSVSTSTRRQCVLVRGHLGNHQHDLGGTWPSFADKPIPAAVPAPEIQPPPQMPPYSRPSLTTYPDEIEQAIAIITKVNADITQQNYDIRKSFLTLRKAAVDVLATSTDDDWTALGKALDDTAHLAADLTGRFRS